jgi:CRP-like cAMP-binding protein
MGRTVHGQPRTGSQGSQLLASLPPRDLESLNRDLERVRLDAERAIMHAHAPVRRVYFPESGLIALSVTMADGRTAGVTMVGSDGIVGLAAAYGDTAPMDATVLVAGTARWMPADRFKAAFRESESLRRIIGMYSTAMLRHLGQMVACNRLHSLDQRSARWLLLARDRIGSDSFPLTQEAFADLLGVSRPAVSTVGARFAREGAAEFRRGTVHIVNTERLEKASCECLLADREALEPVAAPLDEPAHRLARHLPRTAMGLIRPEIRRAR